jgi:hypothetical protein
VTRILAVVLVLALAGCSPARTVEAFGLLRDVARQDVPPDLERRMVSYGAEGRRADIYARAGARAGLILVPGAAVEALDDPRLIGFADALARRGFVVMVPALAGEDPLRVSARDADAVAEAVLHLREAGLDDLVVAAPSYAAGPTILAATRPEIAPTIRKIVTIGAYHDIVESITFVTTGAFREGPDAPWRQGRPDPAAKWIFLAANAATLPDPRDAGALRSVAEAALAGIDPSPHAARLGPEGRAVLALFTNRDPDRVPALIAALPETLRAEIAALDLARADLSGLEAELLLVHGRGDPLVPHTESRRLAARLSGQARLFLLDGLDHVDLGASGPGDGITLLQVAYRLLAARDAVARR